MSNNKLTLVLDSQMVTAYQSCPRKFWYRYKKNIQGKIRRKALDFGTIFHELFEAVNLKVLAGKDISTDILLEVLAKNESLKKIDADERMFIMKRFLEYYVKWYEKDLKQYRLISAEQGFSKIIYEDDETLFVYEGRKDTVFYNINEEMLVWRDYKTFSSQYYVYKHCNQFLGYTWSLSDREVRGEIDYVGKHKEVTDKTFQRVAITFHKDQIERWKKRTIKTFWDIALDGEYELNISACSGKYGVCEYSKLCERSEQVHDQLVQIYYKPREEWSAYK